MLKVDCYNTFTTLFVLILITKDPVDSYTTSESMLQACKKSSIESLKEYYKAMCLEEGFQDIEVELRNDQNVITNCCYRKPELWSDVGACPLPPGVPIITGLQKLRIAVGFDNFGCMRLNLNNLSTIPEDLFAELKNLKSLHFRWKHLENSQRIFEPLKNLKSLDLKLNNLQNVPPDFFGNLKSVSRLNLSLNNLTHLAENAFSGVSSVTDLDLSSNNIVILSGGTFSLLKSLSSINLSANNFDSLPVGLFAVNKNLSSFQMTSNKVQLKYLPDKFLSHLPNLKQVRLSCGLTMISPDFFSKSAAIHSISLCENYLTVLPSVIFADQADLVDLDLSKNQLTTLHDHIFQNLTNLIILRLSHNQLTEISSYIFSSLKNLERLHMDNNRLMRISSTSFDNTERLIYINLQNNRLNVDPLEHNHNPTAKQNLTYWYRDMSKLTLNLRNNSIKMLPRSWSTTDLDLSYNNISFLKLNSLARFGPKKYINLSHNFIRTIHFKTQLQYDWEVSMRHYMYRDQKTYVDMSFNPFHCDCKILDFVLFLRGDAVGKDERLENILKIHTDTLLCSSPENLKYRRVSELLPPELLCPLNNPDSKEKLCPIGCLCWTRDFDKTLIVNCSNGGFLTVPPLGIFHQLEPSYSEGIELHMENNKLATLPSAKTPGYEHIIALFFSHNHLLNISADSLPKNLRILDVSHNKLERLCGSVTKAIAEGPISSVYLGGNPFLCDCQSQDMLQLFHTHSGSIIDREKVLCGGTRDKFKDLTLTSICSPKQHFVIAVSTIAAALGLILGVLVALFYKYNRQIKIWLYAKNLFRECLFEEDIDKDKKYDAFISYSHKDEDFIADYLVPGLENCPTPFKLCLHTRNWIAGHYIPDQILRSVNESRRTIIVLTSNFINSVWARMEFKAAHTTALEERRARLIVVLYGEVGNIAELDVELQDYLRTNTYVKWGEPWFWKKLRYAMPHSSANFTGVLHDFSTENLNLVREQPRNNEW